MLRNMTHLLCGPSGVVLFICCCFCLLPMTANADKFAGEFMSNGGGARALGMGGAFCAVANDASTLYWNPAGISGFDNKQALFMHAEQFGAELNYNFAAFAMPTTAFVSAEREAAFGLAIIHLGAPDIPITNNLPFEDNNGIPGFQPEDGDRLPLGDIPLESSNDFALFSSFAMKTSIGRVGGTLKVLYSDQVTGVSSTGIGVDIGYLRHNVLPRFDIGVKLQDITSTYISWSSGKNELISPSVRVGLAYRLTSPTLQGSLLLTADGSFFFEDRRDASQLWMGSTSADLNFGTEVVFQERVMIRGGFDAGNETAGAGFRFGALGFDYAFLHHDRFESTHRVSGLVNF